MQKALTAKAGTVTVDFTNDSPVTHDVKIAQGAKVLGGTKQLSKGKATADVPLKAGTYTFFCSVDSHRQAGMQGQLTVQ